MYSLKESRYLRGLDSGERLDPRDKVPMLCLEYICLRDFVPHHHYHSELTFGINSNYFHV